MSGVTFHFFRFHLFSGGGPPEEVSKKSCVLLLKLCVTPRATLIRLNSRRKEPSKFWELRKRSKRRFPDLYDGIYVASFSGISYDYDIEVPDIEVPDIEVPDIEVRTLRSR